MELFLERKEANTVLFLTKKAVRAADGFSYFLQSCAKECGLSDLAVFDVVYHTRIKQCCDVS
jgi:hypothetical protein